MLIFTIFAIISLFTLILQVVQFTSTDDWMTISLGQFWFNTDGASLNLVQVAIERHISVDMWATVQELLFVPAWIVFTTIMVGSGVIALIALSTVRRRDRY